MSAPPVSGSLQVTSICVLVAVAVGAGGSGMVLGVPVALDHALGPIAFTARTSMLYWVPLVSPVIVSLRLSPTLTMVPLSMRYS